MSIQAWDVGSLWADTKFAIQHFIDIERIAIIGETKWQHGVATFCKPCTTASVKTIEHEDAQAARDWQSEV